MTDQYGEMTTLICFRWPHLLITIAGTFVNGLELSFGRCHYHLELKILFGSYLMAGCLPTNIDIMHVPPSLLCAVFAGRKIKLSSMFSLSATLQELYGLRLTFRSRSHI